ncbi:MAG: ParB N-terminal domain-containing protein, partial [Cetobacterium sp.]
MEFIKSIDISQLSPADYNPRKINDKSFELLQESLRKFGVLKPVIVNGDKNILTAGHQRTKAMKAIGLKTCPAIRIKNVSIQDEIRFNLFHNSIETNKTNVTIKEAQYIKLEEFTFIDCMHVDFKENKNPTIVKEISRLISKYGEWGSVVIDEDGNIIQNSDYAIACKLLNKNVLVYKLSSEKVNEFLSYMSVDYGEYNYEALGIKAYNQHNCQMNRLRGGIKDNKSSLYEGYVLKNISKENRGVDFGAGQCDYAYKLSKLGYKLFPYEPHFKFKGQEAIDIREIVKMILKLEIDIKQNGLYDYVVLDSVINSITSNDFEKYVLTTCNALLKENGQLYIGTRNKDQIDSVLKNSRCIEKERSIEFLDKDNFSATFRKGVWTLQKFHTKES